MLAVAQSGTVGKCDGYLKARARQVQLQVMRHGYGHSAGVTAAWIGTGLPLRMDTPMSRNR